MDDPIPQLGPPIVQVAASRRTCASLRASARRRGGRGRPRGRGTRPATRNQSLHRQSGEGMVPAAPVQRGPVPTAGIAGRRSAARPSPLGRASGPVPGCAPPSPTALVFPDRPFATSPGLPAIRPWPCCRPRSRHRPSASRDFHRDSPGPNRRFACRPSTPKCRQIGCEPHPMNPGIQVATSRVMCQGEGGACSLRFVFADEDGEEDAVH